MATSRGCWPDEVWAARPPRLIANQYADLMRWEVRRKGYDPDDPTGENAGAARVTPAQEAAAERLKRWLRVRRPTDPKMPPEDFR